MLVSALDILQKPIKCSVTTFYLAVQMPFVDEFCLGIISNSVQSGVKISGYKFYLFSQSARKCEERSYAIA